MGNSTTSRTCAPLPSSSPPASWWHLAKPPCRNAGLECPQPAPVGRLEAALQPAAPQTTQPARLPKCARLQLFAITVPSVPPLGGGNTATGCQTTSAGYTRVGKTSSSDAWNGKTAAQVKAEVDAIPSPAPACVSPAAVGSVPSFLLAIVAIFGISTLQLF